MSVRSAAKSKKAKKAAPPRRRARAPQQRQLGRSGKYGLVAVAVLVVLFAVAWFSGIVTSYLEYRDTESALSRTPDPNAPIIIDDALRAQLVTALPDTPQGEALRDAVTARAAERQVTIERVAIGARTPAGPGREATTVTIVGSGSPAGITTMLADLEDLATVNTQGSLAFGEPPMVVRVERVSVRAQPGTDARSFSATLSVYSRR